MLYFKEAEGVLRAMVKGKAYRIKGVYQNHYKAANEHTRRVKKYHLKHNII